MPENQMAAFREVVADLRLSLTEELSAMVVSGALLSEATDTDKAENGFETRAGKDMWWVLQHPKLKEDVSSPNPSDLSSRLLRQLSALSQLSDGFDIGLPGQSNQETNVSAHVDTLASNFLQTADFQEIIEAALGHCKFCVSIADPRGEDVPLIAVSDEFLVMSGYQREELIGKNCRVLSRNCKPKDTDLRSLREACKSGAPFTKVLLNRRKSGELFLNLLDLRGLVVANNPKSGEDLWFLVGIQADVTYENEEDIPDNFLLDLHYVANQIRAQIVDSLSLMAIGGKVAQWQQRSTGEVASSVCVDAARRSESGEFWYPLLDSRWRPGDQLAQPMSRSTTGPRLLSCSSRQISSRQLTREVTDRSSSMESKEQLCATPTKVAVVANRSLEESRPRDTMWLPLSVVVLLCGAVVCTHFVRSSQPSFRWLTVPFHFLRHQRGVSR